MNLDRSVPSILCFDTLKIWQIKKPEHLTSIEVKRSGFEVAFHQTKIFTKNFGRFFKVGKSEKKTQVLKRLV